MTASAAVAQTRPAGWVLTRIAGYRGWWPAVSIDPLQSGAVSCRVTYQGREYRVIVPASATSVTKPKGA